MVKLAKIQSINPETGEIVQEFDEATPTAVQDAIFRARVAQREWASKPKEYRLDCMSRLKEVLQIRKDQILATVQSETAYPPMETEPEFLDVLDSIDYYGTRYKAQNDESIPLDPANRPDSS